MRETFIGRDVRAGCFVCHGTDAHWWGSNAQGVAARHHDATKHPTWCDVNMTVRYGALPSDDRQIDIEDAIAASSSGDAPECAPIPDTDAPAVPAADVSAPRGRSSSEALAAEQPETANP
jgi:hypothetical protein